jgi:hypothetical protein
MVCGGWHAGEWELAVQALANVTNSNIPGAAHGPLGLPVPQRACVARVRQLAWRARDVARERALASRLKNSSLMLFSNRFSLDFQTKVHLTIHSKVEDQGFLYNNCKGW